MATRDFIACQTGDLKPGGLMEVPIADFTKILIVRTSSGKFFATGNKCTHYGASLAKGVVVGERLTCPWHGSCFNLASGDIEEAPAFDALQTFPVRVVADDVVVTVPVNIPKNWKRDNTFLPLSPTHENKTVLLVGGGCSNLACAEKLRQLGFSGQILLVSGEPHLPYDRPKLSKALSSKPDAIALRPIEFYTQNNIKIMLGHRVKRLDSAKRIAVLDDPQGTTLSYDIAVLAPGGDARLIKAEGHELQGIYPLRNPEDSLAINSDSDNTAAVKHAVVIGSSFIGMETAACLKQSKKMTNVTVVGMEAVAFERVLGSAVGQVLQQIHEKKGVAFRMNCQVTRFIANEKNPARVGAVLLSTGETIKADLVVIGAGVIPATSFLSPDQFKLGRDGSILCDKYLRAEGHDNVFAAGDAACFPLHLSNNEMHRIEHWDVAIQHGRVIASSICNGLSTYNSTPVFWTQSFGTTLRYAGSGYGWDDALVKGDLFDNKFAVFYTIKNDVVAVATLNLDPVMAAFSELLRTGKAPTKALLESMSLDEFQSSL
jgi:apoptosis-inducing factor 3